MSYHAVASQRAEQITVSLNIGNAVKQQKVRQTITGFYVNLHNIHQERDESLKSAREDGKQTEKIIRKAERKTLRNHSKFLDDLKKVLNPIQIDNVKDGLTYGILPRTYNGYLEMLPDLADVQKAKIMELLIEAREQAMDGGSSGEKHAVFGKYKGKINNYLSSEGYDLKKAGEEWQRRIRVKQ